MILRKVTSLELIQKNMRRETDSHRIFAKWKNHFSQIFILYGFSEVRQTKIHTLEPLLPEPSAFEFEMATEKLKRIKSPGTDQIPTEFIKAGSRKNCSDFHKLFYFYLEKGGIA
jgi:hypothetical protein